MCFAEVRQHQQHGCPDTNEKYYDENKDLPLGYGHAPKEGPIATVRLDKQVNKAHR